MDGAVVSCIAKAGRALACLVLAFGSAPTFAQDDAIRGSMAAHYSESATGSQAVPALLNREQRAHYRAVFRAIDQHEWDQVESLLGQKADDLLYPIAAAEYFTDAESPKIDGDRIAGWLSREVDLPQAAQLARMGAKRGLSAVPILPEPIGLRRQRVATKRILPRPVGDGSMPADTSASILAAISGDDPGTARALLQQAEPYLSSAARAEWRQRVAWSYYIENDDRNALALAQTVAEGSGDWVGEGEWVAGLAAWRLNDCARAGGAFSRSANAASNPELAAAAHYWAHRAAIRCREPVLAGQHLHAAARHEETLYGMLASDQRGAVTPATSVADSFTRDDWNALRTRSNVQVAAALVEVDRTALADEVLRHEARIGPARNHGALARLARELGLPSTQLFMAHNAPYGVSSEAALRYPVARWRPTTGWRVDPALAFAHALQESNFRTAAVSPANARGLMQITPITVREHAPRLGLNAARVDLNDPEVNLAFGQRNLEMLRDHPATRRQLPKIMAAYNAGLTPVIRWNTEIRDFGDPLLWMESIPYWETRGYVAIVMRNYWMYERAAGLPSPSRRALAEGRWPDFPLSADGQRARLAR